MRHTQDGYIALDHDPVYEILYYWRNAEISEAYPRAAQCHHIPENAPIWKLYDICNKECQKRNNAANGSKTAPNPIPVNTF